MVFPEINLVILQVMSGQQQVKATGENPRETEGPWKDEVKIGRVCVCEREGGRENTYYCTCGGTQGTCSFSGWSWLQIWLSVNNGMSATALANPAALGRQRQCSCMQRACLSQRQCLIPRWQQPKTISRNQECVYLLIHKLQKNTSQTCLSLK